MQVIPVLPGFTVYTGTPGGKGKQEANKILGLFQVLLLAACATDLRPAVLDPAARTTKLPSVIFEGPLDTTPLNFIIRCEKQGDDGVLLIEVTFKIIVLFNPLIRRKQWALEANTIMTDKTGRVLNKSCVPYTTRQYEIEELKNFLRKTK